ncbi:MAG: fumarate hydratase, partial [Chloroflexota bacterium]|nr:fumarate hydratase [Chloroflexota bacterium]
MPEFRYQEPFPLAADPTPYRLLTTDHVSRGKFEGHTVLNVEPEALTVLARAAMRDVAFLLRPTHLAKVAAILDDPEASANDRGVATALLRNAAIAAEGRPPMCQDTGTAIVIASKGQQVWTGAHDEEHIARGVFETYTHEDLRYSQNAPLTLYVEKNTGSNMPAQIDIYATDGAEYRFLFIAKGGGSANKTYLYQETAATLRPGVLEPFLVEKMKTLGTAACPPYHLA